MSQTLQVQIDQISGSTSKATARTHTVLVDRPVTKGGSDAGPLGGELLLISLGGCFMSNLLAAIRARHAAIEDVRLSVSGTIDGAPERFTAIDITVSATADDQALVEKLVTLAERACLVTNTLRETVALSFRVGAAG